MRIADLCLAAALAAALAAPARAQLLTHKDLSLATALAIATTAEQTCAGQGYHVAAVVLDRDGQTIVAMRGDNASPHALWTARSKAYTARTFRSPSAGLVERLKTNPTLGLTHIPGVIALAGGLPIKVGDDVVGAVGVSGSPGGDKDEACAKAALDKVADQLK